MLWKENLTPVSSHLQADQKEWNYIKSNAHKELRDWYNIKSNYSTIVANCTNEMPVTQNPPYHSPPIQ